MKKIIICMFAGIISMFCYSQKKDSIKVYQGSYVQSFLLVDIDSITHDGDQFVSIYQKENASAYSINNVDSIAFSQDFMKYYQISQEQLNGWDEGVACLSDSEDDFYIVSRTDKNEDNEEFVTICMNNFLNTDGERSVIFNFDKDGNLHDIIYSGYQFKANLFEDNMVFIAFDKEGGVLGSFSVPYEKLILDTSKLSSRRRSPFFNSKGELSLPKIQDFGAKAGSIINTAGNIIGTAINLGEGKYGEILRDFLVGGIVSLIDLPLVASILAEEGIKGVAKFFYEREKNGFLGNAKIEITSVKRTSKTSIVVEGTLSNISSIPSYRTVASEYYPYIQQIPNVVYWGVAEGKSGQPGFYLNDNCTGTISITNDTFSYTFYLENVPGQIHYFRPFLVPEATLKSEEELVPTAFTCIRYGERKEFIDVNVELSNFKQIKCVKENGKYKAQFTIDGSIPGTFEELSGWGIDVKTKSGSYEQRYYAKESSDYYPPLEKTFNCEVTIGENDIENYGVESIAEISITPYITYWNSMPPITYFDSQKYSITIDDDIDVSFYNCSFIETTHLETGSGYICGAIFDASFRVKGGANISSLRIVPVGNFYSWNGASYSSINDGDYTTTITCQHIYEAGLSGDYYCYIVAKDKNGKEYRSNNIIRLNHDGEHFVSCSLANYNSANNSRATVRKQRKRLVHP